MTAWWKHSIIYQVYPRSFQDSNGDGIGDISGITRRLDYLAWIGIDAIWLSPIYPSPMADFGYDVANYKDVHPLFGTLDDLDHLISEASARNIRIILDFVPNHTSDQHPWFIEARASRDNPRRDWYLWRDAKPDGSPPNNWLSIFGGSVWQWDETTGQYYLHSFLAEQPDLNWRNPEVVEAMLGAVHFWMQRGIAGLRVDVIHYLLKDDQWRDDPPNPDYRGGNPWNSLLHLHSCYQPDVHNIVKQFRRALDLYPESVFIGEINYAAPFSEMTAFYGSGDELHLPFNFWMIMLDWDAHKMRQFIQSYYENIPVHGWANYVLSNHDRPRVSTRFGAAQARVAALLLLTLRGTPFIYYGDELGISDVEIPVEKIQDPWGIKLPGNGRDPQRTPMQWDNSHYGGFSDADPWLPLANDFQVNNVASQQRDKTSMLNLYRSLIQYRRSSQPLLDGTFRLLDLGGDNCLVYLRQAGNERILVALNFSNKAQHITDFGVGTLQLSTYMDHQASSNITSFTLRPNEGCIIELISQKHS